MANSKLTAGCYRELRATPTHPGVRRVADGGVKLLDKAGFT
jgi:hypothetical protein